MLKHYNAKVLSLLERCSSSSPACDGQATIKERKDKINWWIKKYFCNDKSLFLAYLRDIGITSDDLFDAMQVNIGNKGQKIYKLCHIWNTNEVYSLPKTCPKLWHSYGFEHLCWPVLAYAEKKFRKIISEVKEKNVHIDSKQILIDADAFLRKRLARLIHPVLALEANLARLGSASNLSSEERFRIFMESFNNIERQKQLWEKYPALWRLISTTADNSVSACIETIQRISNDRRKIGEKFSILNRDKLCSIQWGTGDAHSGGRVVALLHFSSKSIVYKPKSMAAEKAYNEFISWYAKNAPEIPLAYLNVMDCKSYGYKAFVNARECASEVDIKNFYSKLGSLIAIAWVLGITDLHHENIIASGDEPYLIDVEAMFSRPIRHRMKGRPTYEELSNQAFQASLLGTGLLPFRMLGTDGVYDISALGAVGDQPAPSKSSVLENIGRDDVSIIEQSILMKQELNVPVYKGIAARSVDYVSEIIRGYTYASKILEQNKKYLIGSEGVLRKFHNASVRYVARSTMSYAKLLQKMTHPTVLHDALECDMLMAGELKAGLAYAPHLDSLIPSEIKELWEGDIPYFYTSLNSKDLHSSKGNKISDFFECTGYEALLNRLNTLKNYNTQHITTITSSLHSTTAVSADKNLEYATVSDKSFASPDQIIDLSRHIGKQISDNALYINECPFWIGYTPLKDAEYNVNIIRPTLYDGLPGIGIFYAYMYKITRDKKWLHIASLIRKTIKKLVSSSGYAPVMGCGAFNGLAGLIYSDLHISSAIGVKPLLLNDKSFKLLHRLIEKDENYDIISGSSGALLISLNCYMKYSVSSALSAAKAAAERLAATYEKQENGGIAWHTLKTETTKVGGMAHGVAGIAWALSEWANFTNEKKWSQLAQKAFSYELSLYDNKKEVWNNGKGSDSTCFWCYGANGVGQASLHISHVLKDKKIAQAARIAKKITWDYGFMDNHCLCHGNLGNSELYIEAQEWDKAKIILSRVIEDYNAKGRWACGLPKQDSTPGLMCGLAGIGYELLRHGFSKEIPSILALELPREDK